MSSSVVVVEIDTRKGPARTVFESSLNNQTEQAKQFWKTISLAPHIESSLYSKEISQQIRPNTLKECRIDNSRKPVEKDPKTDAFLKYVSVLNQSDDIMRIEKRLSRIEGIRKLHKVKRNKSLNMNPSTRNALVKSESESNWNDKDLFENAAIQSENEYETNPDELNDSEIVRNLDFE